MDSNQMPAPPAANSGLADNAAGALAYVTVIPAILFLVLEPYNKKPFIRYHCFQSIALTIIAVVLSFFMIIPILGWILVPLMELCLFVVWILCVVKAYQGSIFRLPFISAQIDTMAR